MDAISGFRTRLREALERREMSQTELARQLEVRVATVNEWLNRGTMPSGPVMLRLPGILEVDGHWLLTGERRMPDSAEYLSPDRRDRASALLEEALRVLEAREDGGRARNGEVGRVRRPRADERLALEAVDRHRRTRDRAESTRSRRKSG